MAEYNYSSAGPMWSNAYTWPLLLRILKRLAPAPARVFELGCGNGATARLVAERGHEVVAVDPSESGIAIASATASDRVTFAVASTSDDLGGRFGQFPVVISLEVIEHCVSPREFMRAFTSVLAPGGIGIISTPYHGYLKNLCLAVSGRFDHHFDPLWEAGHLRFFTIAKLRELFAEFGFEDPEFHRAGRIPVIAKSVMAVVRRPRL
jgi:SAM-dependent methyltransferase